MRDLRLRDQSPRPSVLVSHARAHIDTHTHYAARPGAAGPGCPIYKVKALAQRLQLGRAGSAGPGRPCPFLRGFGGDERAAKAAGPRSCAASAVSRGNITAPGALSVRRAGLPPQTVRAVFRASFPQLSEHGALPASPSSEVDQSSLRASASSWKLDGVWVGTPGLPVLRVDPGQCSRS